MVKVTEIDHIDSARVIEVHLWGTRIGSLSIYVAAQENESETSEKKTKITPKLDSKINSKKGLSLGPKRTNNSLENLNPRFQFSAQFRYLGLDIVPFSLPINSSKSTVFTVKNYFNKDGQSSNHVFPYYHYESKPCIQKYKGLPPLFWTNFPGVFAEQIVRQWVRNYWPEQTVFSAIEFLRLIETAGAITSIPKLNRRISNKSRVLDISFLVETFSRFEQSLKPTNLTEQIIEPKQLDLGLRAGMFPGRHGKAMVCMEQVQKNAFHSNKTAYQSDGFSDQSMPVDSEQDPSIVVSSKMLRFYWPISSAKARSSKHRNIDKSTEFIGMNLDYQWVLKLDTASLVVDQFELGEMDSGLESGLEKGGERNSQSNDLGYGESNEQRNKQSHPVHLSESTSLGASDTSSQYKPSSSHSALSSSDLRQSDDKNSSSDELMGNFSGNDEKVETKRSRNNQINLDSEILWSEDDPMKKLDEWSNEERLKVDLGRGLTSELININKDLTQSQVESGVALNEYTRLEFCYLMMAREAGLEVPPIKLISHQGFWHLAIKRNDLHESEGSSGLSTGFSSGVYDRGPQDSRGTQNRRVTSYIAHVVSAEALLAGVENPIIRDLRKPVNTSTIGEIATGSASNDEYGEIIANYDAVFKIARSLRLTQIEIEQIFIRMVFAYVYRCLNDNLSKIQFKMDKQGGWHLAPVVGLNLGGDYFSVLGTFEIDSDGIIDSNKVVSVPTLLGVNNHDLALSINDKRSDISEADCLSVALRAGITTSRAKTLIKKVVGAGYQWTQYLVQGELASAVGEPVLLSYLPEYWAKLEP